MLKRADRLALPAFLLWQAWELGRFIRAESRPPSWDQANHLSVAWEYFRALAEGRWLDVWTYAPNAAIPPFPPVYHLLLSAFYLSGDPVGLSLWVNFLYLVVLCVSVANLARLLRPSAPAAGAAALIACAPVVQWLLRDQLVDLPLAACAAAAYWALARSDRFRDRKGSLAFGAAFGLGMLHKWSFFAYVIPAYWLGFQALRDERRRANALAALKLGLLLGLPWYLGRIPLVLVRLTQATNDFVVPFWKGAAFFRYALDLPSQLGWPLVALSAYGAFALRKDAKARPILACALTSYIFWALLPNRQMRYLLPGLTGVAAAAAAAPVPVVWGAAALQAALAVARPSSPPADENWRTREILEAASSARAVAVIANDARFNKLTFTWQAKTMGLPMEFRGVNDIPWELSEFVIFKNGGLGPDSVTKEFQPAAAQIRDPKGWFAEAFVLAKSWPLPDGTKAELYARRPLKATTRPLEGPLRASSLVSAPRCTFSAGRLRCPELFLQGVRFLDVDAALTDAVALSESGIRFVRIGGIHIRSARLAADPIRGLKVVQNDLLRLSGRAKGLPVSAAIALRPGDASAPCRVDLVALKAAGIPLSPRFFLSYAANGPLLDLDVKDGVTTVSTIFGLHRSAPFPVSVASCSPAGVP